ncbi:hypothetical protein [Halalkalibacter alkalisediminis]|uniref:Lipoprotein n=1 Tax=Halalkalibacter alkalisediminis TaxID=935616 RepID=A0ABV6NGV0_9BACI|nr:hypothetical protein [Halalkalibacter alkalisediminis]
MKKLIMVSYMAFMLIGLVGCGTATTDETEEEDVVSGDVGVEVENDVGEDPLASGGIDASEIKEISVEVEGETEMRKAQFNRSGLGYSIYVLEDYQLVSEEPERDVIFSTYDDRFFTRINVHGAGADADQIKNTIMEHANGEIEEDVEIPIADAEFALHELVESNGEITSITYVAKEYNGQLIEFTIFLPNKEPAEGAGPSMWAMLETVDF